MLPSSASSTTRSNTGTDPAPHLWIGAAMAVGLLLRVPGLTARPLWLDEAIQSALAQAPDPLTLMRAQDLHPPLLTWLQRLWPGAIHEATLRMPSLLAGVATIPVTAWAATTWYGRPAGRRAALLAATLPPWIAYSTEARPYALAVMLTALFLGSLRHTHGAASAVAAALAASAQYTTWPVLMIGALARTHHRAHVLAATGVTTASLYLGVMRYQQQAQGRALSDGFLAPWFWAPHDMLSFTAQRLPELLGYPLTGTHGRVAWVLGVLLCAGMFWTRRAVDKPDPLTVVVWLPIGMVWLAAGVGLHPFGGIRHILALTPGLVIWGSGRLNDRGAAFAAAIALLAWTRHPGLPVQDVACLLQETQGQVWLDASVTPTVQHYAPLRAVHVLPWRSGEKLISEAHPEVPFWLLATEAREADLQAALKHWAGTDGQWTPYRECEGVVGWYVNR